MLAYITVSINKGFTHERQTSASPSLKILVKYHIITICEQHNLKNLTSRNTINISCLASAPFIRRTTVKMWKVELPASLIQVLSEQLVIKQTASGRHRSLAKAAGRCGQRFCRKLESFLLRTEDYVTLSRDTLWHQLVSRTNSENCLEGAAWNFCQRRESNWRIHKLFFLLFIYIFPWVCSALALNYVKITFVHIQSLRNHLCSFPHDQYVCLSVCGIGAMGILSYMPSFKHLQS